MLTSDFYKQTDGFPMGGLLSVIFLIQMTKTVHEVVGPPKPKFYKRFVVYIINRRYQPGDFFEKLSSNYPNMKYRVEVKPENLHDTKIVYNNDVITAEVQRNEIKLPVHWSSKVPKRHRRNVIISDLNRATHIASFPADEIPKIKQKFLITFLKNQRRLATISFLLISMMFKKSLVDIPYCPMNEKFSKRFMKMFDVFTDNKYDICINWITKKVKQLFKLKSRNLHPSCVIQEGVCSCQEPQIGETVRNVEIWWQEHEDTQKDSELAKHLKNNPIHLFSWKVPFPALSNRRIGQNMEASIIPLK